MTTKGFTVWLTGLSGAGKSTIAQRLLPVLRARGLERVEILDGDEVREHLSAGLGFSRADRDTNIRRIAYVCRLLGRHGVVTIVAAISPYRAARDEARRLCGEFVEVFVDAPLAVAEARDPKGLYRRARAGAIPAFTGVSDPYEPPEVPDVHCPTDRLTLDESVAVVVDGLERRGLVPPGEALCTPEEEARILARLGELGYLEAGRSS
jgi:adenylylsulfate kinase